MKRPMLLITCLLIMEYSFGQPDPGVFQKLLQDKVQVSGKSSSLQKFYNAAGYKSVWFSSIGEMTRHQLQTSLKKADSIGYKDSHPSYSFVRSFENRFPPSVSLEDSIHAELHSQKHFSISSM